MLQKLIDALDTLFGRCKPYLKDYDNILDWLDNGGWDDIVLSPAQRNVLSTVYSLPLVGDDVGDFILRPGNNQTLAVIGRRGGKGALAKAILTYELEKAYKFLCLYPYPQLAPFLLDILWVCPNRDNNVQRRLEEIVSSSPFLDASKHIVVTENSVEAFGGGLKLQFLTDEEFRKQPDLYPDIVVWEEFLRTADADRSLATLDRLRSCKRFVALSSRYGTDLEKLLLERLENDPRCSCIGLATWESNPYIDKHDEIIQKSYRENPEQARLMYEGRLLDV